MNHAIQMGQIAFLDKIVLIVAIKQLMEMALFVVANVYQTIQNVGICQHALLVATAIHGMHPQNP